MKVYFKLVDNTGKKIYTTSYVKRFDVDGEIVTTQSIDEARNFNDNYFSCESLEQKFHYIQSLYNENAIKVKCLVSTYIIRVGKLYVMDINGYDKTQLALTSELHKAKPFHFVKDVQIKLLENGIDCQVIETMTEMEIDGIMDCL